MNRNDERILVIKLGALGDVILAMPAFQAIRESHPHAKMTLLTRKAFTAFASEMPWFDAVMTDPVPKGFQVAAWWNLRRHLRSQRFDRVYDLQSNDRTLIYRQLMRPSLADWKRLGTDWRVRDSLMMENKISVTERLLVFLEASGVPRPTTLDLSWLDAPLDGFKLPAGYVLIIPGCAPQHQVKRWPPSHYARLAHLLQTPGRKVVAIGTRADEDAIRQIQILAPHVISLAGKTSIRQVAALARHAECVVGNDTGPIHIAGIVGAPTLVLMSRVTDPVRMLPSGPLVSYLKRDHLAELSPEQVFASLVGREAYHESA